MKQLIFIKPTVPFIVSGIFEVENNKVIRHLEGDLESLKKKATVFIAGRDLAIIPEVTFLNTIRNAHVIINTLGGSYVDAAEPMEIIACDNAEVAEYLAFELNKQLNDAEYMAQAIYSMDNSTYNISNYKDVLKIEFIDNIINYKEDDTLN